MKTTIAIAFLFGGVLGFVSGGLYYGLSFQAALIERLDALSEEAAS